MEEDGPHQEPTADMWRSGYWKQSTMKGCAVASVASAETKHRGGTFRGGLGCREVKPVTNIIRTLF